MSQLVKIKLLDHLTHDVIRIKTNKPKGLSFTPGQAVDIALNKPGWEDTLSCFTFTSLPEDNYVEFIIKTYPSRKRLSNELLSTKVGDEIIIHKPFGDIKYKGKGIFIAGGAGITPFLAILKTLDRDKEMNGHKLIFANKTSKDIILLEHFHEKLGKNFINILSEEECKGYEHGYITKELIKKHSNKEHKYYYLCGPKPMMEAVEKHLIALGVKEEFIVKESF